MISVKPEIAVASKMVQKSADRSNGNGVIRIHGQVRHDATDKHAAEFTDKRNGPMHKLDGHITIYVDEDKKGVKVPFAENNTWHRNFELVPGAHMFVIRYSGEKPHHGAIILVPSNEHTTQKVVAHVA